MINSIPLILKSCEEKGFTLKNLSDLLTLLIKKFIPHSENLVKSVKTDHPEEYLRIITDSIDVEAEADHLETLIDLLERDPKETISEICARSKHLHVAKLKLRNPKIDSEELNTRANRAVMLNLNSWVTDACWAKIVEWRNPIEKDGKMMSLDQYTDKIIEIEKRPKYRPKTKLRNKSKPDYTALATIAQVGEDDGNDEEAMDQEEDPEYSDEEGEDDLDVQFVRSNDKSRGRGRGRGRGRNGDRRSQTTSRRQSRPTRREHPRRRSYSRTYTRTSSFPAKQFYRSPNGTYRNNSTNSSRGRSPSLASSNSSTRSQQKREYLQRSLYNLVSERTRKCLRCGGDHESQFCPRYPHFSKDICSWCFRKHQLALYHSEINCYQKKQANRSSNYIEQSPNTLHKKYVKRQSAVKRGGASFGRRFKSPSNEFAKNQFTGGLRGNGNRGKK